MIVRIGYVCSDSGVRVHGPSGSSVHVRSLVRALGTEGADVAVVAARRGDGPAELEVEEARPGPAGALLAKRPGAGRELGQLLAVASAIRKLERQHRGAPFDLIYERLSLWGLAGLDFALKHDVPFFLEVNAPLVDEAAQHRGLVLESAAREVERLLLTRADRVFVVSRPLLQHALDCGADARRVIVTPNGVDPELFGRIEPNGRMAGGPLRVGFVGSLKPWHGLPVMIEAFRRLCAETAARLVVVGDGPLRPELEGARAELPDGCVSLVGAVEHERVPELLAGCDVALAPYPSAETYFSPLKVVEAMAAGCCVVASRTSDLEDLIEDGVNGVLVEPGDPQALCEALLRLDADRPLARRLGLEARALVLARRTWGGVARRVLDELTAVRQDAGAGLATAIGTERR